MHVPRTCITRPGTCTKPFSRALMKMRGHTLSHLITASRAGNPSGRRMEPSTLQCELLAFPPVTPCIPPAVDLKASLCANRLKTFSTPEKEIKVSV